MTGVGRQVKGIRGIDRVTVPAVPGQSSWHQTAVEGASRMLFGAKGLLGAKKATGVLSHTLIQACRGSAGEREGRKNAATGRANACNILLDLLCDSLRLPSCAGQQRYRCPRVSWDPLGVFKGNRGERSLHVNACQLRGSCCCCNTIFGRGSRLLSTSQVAGEDIVGQAQATDLFQSF